MYPNQAFDNSPWSSYPMNNNPAGNDPFVNPAMMPMQNTFSRPKPAKSARQGSNLFLPALILFIFSWILHTLATFLPYWSTYSAIADSRAGLWNARNVNFTSIQNFYFPEPNEFPNLTHSVSFTTSNAKAYVVTVQYLMTFNFAVMFIVLILLILDYIFSRDQSNESRAFLNQPLNNYDTGMKFGLLLYIIYVFGAFEFASWITYVGSRQDNNWEMHVSFAFAIIVSVFLIIIFALYALEFLKRSRRNRKEWQYWYGPYIQWAFFIHLTALIFLLTTICCPEWAYGKNNTFVVFFELGLFKQCFLGVIYQRTLTTLYCTLSDTGNNQSWVRATQAFILMAYIIGTILWFLMIIYRKEFRHNQNGYVVDRVSQPTFTFIMAGLILFFCFIFSLIGVSIFGAKVFSTGLIVNWGYILAVIAMVLFLIVGILLILDGLHSERQSDINDYSFASNLFPAPLNQRALMMEPLLKPKPIQPFETNISPGAMFSPWNNGLGMYPPGNSMYMPPNYGYGNYMNAPIAQAGLTNYFQQAMMNPQLSAFPMDQPGMAYPSSQDALRDSQLSYLIREQLLQQQRLNQNHELLLERYQRLTGPRTAEFRPFGSSVLPGRNYNEYLDMVEGAYRYDDTLAAIARSRVYASPSTRESRLQTIYSNREDRRGDSRRRVNRGTHETSMEPVPIYDCSSKKD